MNAPTTKGKGRHCGAPSSDNVTTYSNASPRCSASQPPRRHNGFPFWTAYLPSLWPDVHGCALAGLHSKCRAKCPLALKLPEAVILGRACDGTMLRRLVNCRRVQLIRRPQQMANNNQTPLLAGRPSRHNTNRTGLCVARGRSLTTHPLRYQQPAHWGREVSTSAAAAVGVRWDRF